MSRFFRLWPGLGDMRKAPSDKAIEVPVDEFATLVEHVILLLGQVSLSASYNRQLNILKMIIIRDPTKAKTMLKENENVLRDIKSLLWKKVSISYDRDKKN